MVVDQNKCLYFKTRQVNQLCSSECETRLVLKRKTSLFLDQQPTQYGICQILTLQSLACTVSQEINSIEISLGLQYTKCIWRILQVVVGKYMKIENAMTQKIWTIVLTVPNFLGYCAFMFFLIKKFDHQVRMQKKLVRNRENW